MMAVLFMALSLMMLSKWEFIILGLSSSFLMMVFSSEHSWGHFCLSQYNFLDNLSWALSSLSIWAIMVIMLSSSKDVGNFKYFSFFMNSLLFILLLAYSTKSLMLFYLWFELSALPTFILILGWGGQPERMKATTYFVIYLTTASLPLLIMLAFLEKGGEGGFSPKVTSGYGVGGWVLTMSLMLAFLVKLPLYYVHLWLVKAHVEAPVAGSMILASILLKLGGYGLIRVVNYLPYLGLKSLESVSSWALVGGLTAGFMCLRRMDIKVVVALSSVAHMALVASGILTLTEWGVSGAIFIMVGHGFGASALFYLSNISSIQAGGRNFHVLKGLHSISPALSLWFFMMIAINMSAPPSMNLLGEVGVMISLVAWSSYTASPLMILIFMAAAYSLNLYMKSQHGKPMAGSGPGLNLSPSNSLTLFLHWVPVNFLILKWDVVMMHLIFSKLYL